MDEGPKLPEVVEMFRDYSSPLDVAAIMRDALRRTPSKYLVGLRRVVLTNASGMSHDRRRQKTWSRKKKVRIRDASGSYHQAWGADPAWIEIFVDNIIEGMDPLVFRVSFLRRDAFLSVLFHEVGHHIQTAIYPEYREKEDVADDWGEKLGGAYSRRRYWYAMPLALPLAFLVGVCRKLWSSVQKKIEGSVRARRAQ